MSGIAAAMNKRRSTMGQLAEKDGDANAGDESDGSESDSGAWSDN
jgi:hypothetical protein